MILSDFREYYETLSLILKDEKLSLDNIQSQLLNILQKQLKETGNNSEIQNGIYLQVALTDELFLEKSLPGWRDKMLEHQLFNSQQAGEKIVEDLEALIHDPLSFERETIYVTFLTLAFGFKGKLSKSAIQKYKIHLSRILFPEGISMEYLMAGNFYFTEKKSPTGYVPDVKLWLKIFTSVLLAYIIGTSIYWWSIQKEMKDIVNALAKHTHMRSYND
jgi:type VI protein secretion system component VasF